MKLEKSELEKTKLEKIESDNFKDMKIKLRNYQKNTIYRMQNLENNESFCISNDVKKIINTNNGILADVRGSGKTMMMLGLIGLNKNIKNGFKEYKKGICFENINNENHKNANIIIVPKYLIYIWQLSIQTNTHFKCATVYTNKDLIKYIDKLEDNTYENIVIISSYLFFKNINKFTPYKFNRLIFDEYLYTNKNTPINLDLKISCLFKWFICDIDILDEYFKIQDQENAELIDPFYYKIMSCYDRKIMTNLVHFTEHKYITISSDILEMLKEYKPCSLKNIDTSTLYSRNILNLNIFLNNLNIDELLNNINCNFLNKEDLLKDVNNNMILSDTRKNEIINKIDKLHSSECELCSSDFSNNNLPIMFNCCYNVICSRCLIQMILHSESQNLMIVKCHLCRQYNNPSNIYKIIKSDKSVYYSDLNNVIKSILSKKTVIYIEKTLDLDVSKLKNSNEKIYIFKSYNNYSQLKKFNNDKNGILLLHNLFPYGFKLDNNNINDINLIIISNKNVNSKKISSMFTNFKNVNIYYF